MGSIFCSRNSRFPWLGYSIRPHKRLEDTWPCFRPIHFDPLKNNRIPKTFCMHTLEAKQAMLPHPYIPTLDWPDWVQRHFRIPLAVLAQDCDFSGHVHAVVEYFSKQSSAPLDDNMLQVFEVTARHPRRLLSHRRRRLRVV